MILLITIFSLPADFQENYYHMNCSRAFNTTDLGQLVNNTALLPSLLNETELLQHLQHTGCHRENSLLFLLLMLGTVWLAVSLYNFNKTPYLQVRQHFIFKQSAIETSVKSNEVKFDCLLRDRTERVGSLSIRIRLFSIPKGIPRMQPP